jgi:D-glycero-D-manno-heptose 1,7-bisphosphate phosphatase
MSIPVIFLDKDGTLIENVHYNVDPAKMCFTKGAEEGIRHLADAGFFFVIVTNQHGIALGKFKEEDLKAVRMKIYAMMGELNAPVIDFYYCPHHPEGTVPQYSKHCLCRKPMPGMIEKAIQEHEIDLASSWLIGDILDDVEAGNRAGVRTILLDNGNEKEWAKGLFRSPMARVPSLKEAAEFILLKKGMVYV